MRNVAKEQGEASRDRVLIALDDLTARGYSPSFREVAEEADLGLTTASHHLRILRKAGKVTWVDGLPRTLRRTDG